MSHDYFRTDPRILWATVQESVPRIVSQANRILSIRSDK
ncbi:MAG: hypothetical protein JO328_05950 [Hyphomicrobiales bacterium]|nr:hypothetical protein [Hyphomicrobiales bacterium]MBV8824760.1 hypothetical protein [Hyphomicrobiales bacterium]MBV9428821.1 hypothetical protein [Bradyrhizobiaceae bacterium]